MSNIVSEIRTELHKYADEKYRDFVTPLIPNAPKGYILGVRLPILRKIAKQVANNDDWQAYLSAPARYFEEVMWQGMVIGQLKLPIEKSLELVRNFIPKITNWSICDTFCSDLKCAKKYPKPTWDFLQSYVCSKQEFDARFALVMMLKYFINDEYIHLIFENLPRTKNNQYYSKMALAWLLSMCYAKFPDDTEQFILNSNIDSQTLAKTIQKIQDSYQISAENKQKATRWSSRTKGTISE